MPVSGELVAIDERAIDTGGLERLVAVHRRVGPDLRDRPAGDQPYLKFDALRMPMPGLHNAVLKMPPVAPVPTPEDATVNLNSSRLPGTVVFVGAVIAALLAASAGAHDRAALRPHGRADDAVAAGDQLHGRRSRT